MTLPDPTRLAEVLRTAREARFIDLARVERETRIPARYLAALEHGEYRDLPAPVYVKGFIRNYGLFLGLDPRHLAELYRAELGVAVHGRTRTDRRHPARRPVGRSGLRVTTDMLAAVLVGTLVIGLAAYVGAELLTFGRTPALTISVPAGDVASWSSRAFQLRGTTEPGATVVVSGLPENPTATADPSGTFFITLSLLPGANLISIVAHDSRTGRDSAVVRRTISVSLPRATASERPR